METPFRISGSATVVCILCWNYHHCIIGIESVISLQLGTGLLCRFLPIMICYNAHKIYLCIMNA